MITRGRECKMPCESCGIQFSVFKRKRACSECERYYCSGCLRRGGGTMCAPCRVLSTRPLSKQSIAHLKVRDLQCFLQKQNVSARGCVEKEELLNLCVSHVNSGAYRRRGPRSNASAFCTLKGLTTEINDFITSAFDLRNPTGPPPSNRSNCFNSAHLHSPSTHASDPTINIPDRRFTPTPGGERNIDVAPPEAGRPPGSGAPSEAPSEAHVESSDCFEIEDVDDAAWEFVAAPAEPLPNDSSVLLSEAGASGRSPQRAASSLELRSLSAADARSEHTGSLQDEHDLGDRRDDDDDEPAAPQTTPGRVQLSRFKLASELDALNVKQLKELLARNRVEFRGCLERTELLERARTLWADHDKYRNETDDLPLEDSCKICMAAPLECVLLECGHIASCTECARLLAECPICRQYVVRAVRVFRS